MEVPEESLSYLWKCRLGLSEKEKERETVDNFPEITRDLTDDQENERRERARSYLWTVNRQADTKNLTSSSKFSGSCVLT